MANPHYTTDANQVDTTGPAISSPTFSVSSIHDAGKVRIGAQGPIFKNPEIRDSGKVRIGAQGPLFR